MDTTENQFQYKLRPDQSAWYKRSFISILILVISLILTLSFKVYATEVNDIITDTTWTKVNSPYVVTNTVQVLEGVTLIIEPGVTVKFNNGTGLNIGGKLVVVGTADEMITFTSNQPVPQPQDWIGIKFTNASIDAQVDDKYNYLSGSIIKHCIIEYAADSAIALEYSSPYVFNNIIRNNFSTRGGGIFIYQSSPIIKNNIINNNVASIKGGGIYMYGSSPLITHNIVANNSVTSNSVSEFGGGGIYVENKYGGVARILFNIIEDNTATYGGAILISWGRPSSIDYQAEINYNNIINNVSNYYIYSLSDDDIRADNNYWGTSDTLIVDEKIYDYYDNISFGKVFYEPIAIQPYRSVDFWATPFSGSHPLEINFTNNSIGIIYSETWDFGDGEISSDLNPSHTYTSPGTYTVRLTVAGIDGTNTETKTDYVTVTIPTYPDIVISPASYDLGSIPVGSSSSQTITVSNIGTADLTISSIILSGTNASEFSQTNNCLIVEPNGTCTITVTFSPTNVSSKTATLTIVSNDPDTPTVGVTLTGRGVPGPVPDISVSPSNHNFGDVTEDSLSSPLVVIISNEGITDLNISEMKLSDTSNYSLNVNGGLIPCNSTVKVLASKSICTVIITFNPISTGTFNATLAIESDDTDTPNLSISLTGKGISINDTGPSIDSSKDATNEVTDKDENSGGNASSGKGGCFIATAAYGSYLDPNVQVLREFRDNYLLTNSIGRAFVKLYYRTSPSIADLITQHESLKTTTRLILTPIVYGINFPGSVLLILIGIIVIPVVWRVRYWSKSR